MPAATANLLIQPMRISRLHKAPAFLELFSYEAEIIGQVNPATQEHRKFSYLPHRGSSFLLRSQVEIGCCRRREDPHVWLRSKSLRRRKLDDCAANQNCSNRRSPLRAQDRWPW